MIVLLDDEFACSSQYFYAVIAGNIDGMKELLAKNDDLDVDSIDSVSNI